MNKLKRRILAGAAAFAMMGMHLAVLPPGTFPEIFSVQEMVVHAVEANPATVEEYEAYLTNHGFKYSRLTGNDEDPSVYRYQISGYTGSSLTPVIPGERLVSKTADDSTKITCEVVWISYGAFASNTKITSITIPPQVKTIFASSFEGCTALKSVRFTPYQFLVPNPKAANIEAKRATLTTDSALTKIGDKAFKDCAVLETINLPEGMTLIGERTFENCTALKSIDFPDSLTELSLFAFAGSGLTGTVKIPPAVQKWSTGIFFECPGITEFEGPTYEENPKFYVENGMILVPWGEGGTGRAVVQAPAAADFNEVPDNATSVLYSAFSGCTSDIVYIGENVSELHNLAFYEANIGELTLAAVPRRLMPVLSGIPRSPASPSAAIPCRRMRAIPRPPAAPSILSSSRRMSRRSPRCSLAITPAASLPQKTIWDICPPSRC